MSRKAWTPQSPSLLLWGDLNPGVVQRSLNVRLNSRCNGNWRDDWSLEVTHRPTGKRFGVVYAFSLLEMHTSPSVMAHALKDAVLALAVEMAPNLYLYDPRIGTPFAGVHGDPLPACPLFDRPDRLDRAQESVLFGDGSTAKAASHVPLDCPFCQEPLWTTGGGGRSKVWAGGALCWVHGECLCPRSP